MLQGMLGVAINRYLDAIDFQRSLSDLTAELVVTRPGKFEVKTTSLTLPHMLLLRADESLPRIAHIRVPASPALISFSLAAQPCMQWNGITMRPGDFVIHVPGERLHQRTSGASNWGLLSVNRDFLVRHAAAVLRTPILPKLEGTLLRALPRESGEFAKLHEKAIEFVERRPVRIGYLDVAHALEQDLLYALLGCLDSGERRAPSRTRRFRAIVMNRMAAILADDPSRPFRIADLCAAIGVSDRTLRTCCYEVLGMSPAAYMRLYRLTYARAALINAKPGTVGIAETARRFGFTEAGRFAAAYRAAFGELPSATLAQP